MRRSLTKDERLRKKKDFERLYSSPHRYQTAGMKLFYLPCDRIVFGVSLGRKFRTAVSRNRQKRWVREIFRNWKFEEPIKGEFLFVPLPGNYGFIDRKTQFFELIGKLKKDVRK